MTAENPKATYACINKIRAAAPPELAGRGISIEGDIGAVLALIAEEGAYDTGRTADLPHPHPTG